MYWSVKKPLHSNCTGKKTYIKITIFGVAVSVLEKTYLPPNVYLQFPFHLQTVIYFFRGSSKLINLPTKIKKVFNFFLLDKELR
jgi:hypothetical protein